MIKKNLRKLDKIGVMKSKKLTYHMSALRRKLEREEMSFSNPLLLQRIVKSPSKGIKLWIG